MSHWYDFFYDLIASQVADEIIGNMDMEPAVEEPSETSTNHFGRAYKEDVQHAIAARDFPGTVDQCGRRPVLIIDENNPDGRALLGRLYSDEETRGFLYGAYSELLPTNSWANAEGAVQVLADEIQDMKNSGEYDAMQRAYETYYGSGD